MKHLERVLLLAPLLAACGGAAGGQLEPRFVAVHNALSSMGLAQSGPISEGSLPEGGVVSVPVQLQGGECYTFVALASAGIQDVDIRVVGEGDTEIARDVTHDRQAAARACPDASGEFQVRVTAVEGGGGYLISHWSGAPRGGGQVMASNTPGGGAGTCGEPIDIEFGTPVMGDTTGSPNSLSGTCVQGGAPERVHRFVVEQRGQVTMALSSSYDGVLYLLRECGQIQTQIDCNDDNPDTSHSLLSMTLDAGTYYLYVDGYGDAAGAYELNVTHNPVQPVSVVCGGATPLAQGQPASGTTVGGVDYFQATCADGARQADRVYSFNVQQRSRIRLRQTSDHDGALYVRSSCADSASEIACNDDFVNQQRSLVTTVVDPGQYFAYADGFGSGNSAVGNFTLSLDTAPAAGGGATGDDCQAPATPPTGPFQLDTMNAADDLRGSCGGQNAADVAYALNIRARTRVDVLLRETEFAGAMYIQRTCGDVASEVSCQPIMRGADSRLTQVLDPGQYTLVIDGQTPESFGASTAEITLTDLAALERSCRRAPLLRAGRTVNGTTAGETDDFHATCAGEAQSPDVLYRLRVTRRSVVRVEMSTQDFDGAVHIRRDCGDPTTEVACNDDEGDNRHSRVQTTLDPGTYFVIVDGFQSGNSGSYSLEVDVSRP